MPSPSRHRAPVTPAACRDAVSEVAQWWMEAERPVLLTARAGRTPDGMAALDRLVTLTGTPVGDSREVLNLPSSHECYIEDDAVAADLLRSADLVVVVDHEVPWVPLNRQPPETARVVQIDIDPVKQTMINWAFPVDLPIQADSGKALWQILAALEEKATPEIRARWEKRREALAAAKRQRAEARERLRETLADQPVIAAELVAQALNEALPAEAIVMEEVTTNDMLVREHLERTAPGTIHAIGAAGLGWALGAALGVKLAEPERQVVAFVGDGTFMFSAPLAALWTARDAGAPFLTVILNNSGYRAAMFPVRLLFPDGVSVRENDFTGTVFSESVDFAAAARSAGAFGITISDPGEIAAGIAEARRAVSEGRCAVVDVRLERI